jgi:hypothetical protein
MDDGFAAITYASPCAARFSSAKAKEDCAAPHDNEIAPVTASVISDLAAFESIKDTPNYLHPQI